MTWHRGQVEEIIATPAQMKRFGITNNFDVDRNDPRNATYLVPLADPQAEEYAWIFSDAVHGSICHENC